MRYVFYILFHFVFFTSITTATATVYNTRDTVSQPYTDSSRNGKHKVVTPYELRFCIHDFACSRSGNLCQTCQLFFQGVVLVQSLRRTAKIKGRSKRGTEIEEQAAAIATVANFAAATITAASAVTTVTTRFVVITAASTAMVIVFT